MSPEKKATPKTDALRAAREARYEEAQARRKAEIKAAKVTAAGEKPKPVKRPKKKPAT